jgi:hypothetical protein
MPSALRYCYNNLLNEEELHDTAEQASLEQGKLLRCAKCKGAWYASKEAQRQHWKFHKHTCSPPRPAHVNGMTLSECVNTLRRQMEKPATMDGNTVLVMRRIRLLMEQQPDSSNDAGFQLHTMARGFMSDEQALPYYKTLWGAPGMTQFLMTESLYSTTVAARRTKYPDGVPDELRGLSEEEKEEVHEWQTQEDISAYNFAFLLFNILVHTAISSSPSMSGSRDGLGNVRGYGVLNPNLAGLVSLAMAAGKRALALWLDSDVRSSCGDALAPAPGMCQSLIKTQLDMQGLLGGTSKLFRFDVQLLPVIAACVNELNASTASAQQTRALLKTAKSMVVSRRYSSGPLAQPAPHQECHLPVEQIPVAAVLAVLLLDKHWRCEEPFNGATDPDLEGSDWKFSLLDACWTTPMRRLQIWERAGVAAPGGHWDERAFFQFLLQKCSAAALRALAATNKGGLDAVFKGVADVSINLIALFAAEPLAIDTKVAFAEWEALSWDRDHHQDQVEAVEGVEAVVLSTKQRCFKAVVPQSEWDWLNKLYSGK